jgi:plasminogen activator inhibitor 1 RNA-binding protein
VTATPEAQTTVESLLTMAPKETVLNEPVALTKVVDEAEVTLIDIAAELEGTNAPPTMAIHVLTIFSESEKQAAHGWGANEGGAELKDEQAGEAIAKAEQKEALTGDGDAAPTDGAADTEAEPEDNSISYTDYLAQLAEKKLALGSGIPEARKPNEGSKQDKKWASAKAITKEEEEDFVAGSGGKAKRERERKQKQTIEIDQRFVEAPERTGGRGAFRGNRGGRGDGPPRGGRGEFRGRGDRGAGRGRGDRGAPRGGAHRGNAHAGGPSINTDDTSAFPSLGS